MSVQDLDDAERVDADRRLVEDEHARVLDQGIGDPEPLAHPARVLAGLPIGGVGQSDPVEDLGQAVLGEATAQAVERRGVAQVLTAAEVAIEAGVVGQVADPALDLQGVAGRVEPDHQRLAVIGLGQAEQHQDRGRLARAVRSEQPVDLAPLDLEIERVDDGPGAVSLGQPDRLDERLVHRSAPAEPLEDPAQPEEGEHDQADPDDRPGQRGVDRVADVLAGGRLARGGG